MGIFEQDEGALGGNEMTERAVAGSPHPLALGGEHPQHRSTVQGVVEVDHPHDLYLPVVHSAKNKQVQKLVFMFPFNSN